MLATLWCLGLHSPPSPRSIRARARQQRALPACSADALTREFEEQWVQSGLFEGATVVIMRHDGVVYRHHFGTHRPDSVVCVHSMTKTITSIACLQCAERGLLSLDDAVGDYLPSFREGEYGKITLRMCLGHTSGLDYHLGVVRPTVTWDRAQWREALRFVTTFYTRDLRGHVDSCTARSPLRFAPGTQYNYADGANVAAAVVEVVSQQGFAEYVREHISAPLGMEDTTCVTSRAEHTPSPQPETETELLSPNPVRTLTHTLILTPSATLTPAATPALQARRQARSSPDHTPTTIPRPAS